MKKIALYLILAIFMVSCATPSLDRPGWVRSGIKVFGFVVNIGYGEGNTEKEAMDRAYADALISMGQGLGFDPTELYLRELISQNSIKDIGSFVADTYVENDNTGYKCWVRIDTPESRYRSARSEEYVAILDRESRIAEKLDNSLFYYRNNRDTEAIESILEAVVLSLEGKVNNADYSPDNLLSKAMEYMESLTLTLHNERQGEIGVTVRLSRAKGIFYPPVVNAMVESVYEMNTTTGHPVPSNFSNITDENGEFDFTMTNPYILRDGAVKFYVSIDSDLLNRIEAASSKEFIQPFRDLIENKSIFYNYYEEPKLDVESTIIALSHYNINGVAIDNQKYIDLFLKYLEDTGSVGWTVVEEASEEISEIYEILKYKYPDQSCYIIARIGITDQSKSPLKAFSRTESRLAIVDGATGEELVIQDSYASGMGTDFEESDDDALKNQTMITAGLLLEEL